jgi:hypothetical protein
MSGDKRRTSKTSGRRGVAALGVAGALSLASGVCGACGASASTSPAGNMQNSTRVKIAVGIAKLPELLMRPQY